MARQMTSAALFTASVAKVTAPHAKVVTMTTLYTPTKGTKVQSDGKAAPSPSTYRCVGLCPYWGKHSLVGGFPPVYHTIAAVIRRRTLQGEPYHCSKSGEANRHRSTVRNDDKHYPQCKKSAKPYLLYTAGVARLLVLCVENRSVAFYPCVPLSTKVSSLQSRSLTGL